MKRPEFKNWYWLIPLVIAIASLIISFTVPNARGSN